MTTTHDAAILDQFTRQAAPFAERHGRDHELLDLIVEMSGVGAADRVLDVACGPGLVACALATRAGHVTGLDFTPAMLARAEQLQHAQQRKNLNWQQGSATALPYADGAFDCVVTRFSLHHYLSPADAFREMARVCRPGGTILVADVSPRADARDAYDRLEKHRDPSHTRALTAPEFDQLGSGVGARPARQARYDLVSDVDGLLASSFPAPGGAEAFRQIVEADLVAGSDTLGLRAHRHGAEIRFFFPVLIQTWKNGRPVKSPRGYRD